VAFSNGDGTFRITNTAADDFAGGWAQAPGVRAVTGDFDNDKRTDIALLPGPGTSWWHTIPVAFANGDGTFRITNAAADDFAGVWAQAGGVQVATGDFNNDGRTDLALTGAGGWFTIPVALSDGSGTFTVRNGQAGVFAVQAAS
jgi:FG-GAP-like repeat